MLDNDGIVKLIDFGASKQFNSQNGGAFSTSAVTYTNGFAPYEQMERSYEKFGPWTDFYALGATVYNLLANKTPPMPGDINDDDTVDKRISLPLPDSVSEHTRDLLLWLLKPNRLERPRSVADILKFMDARSVKPTPVPELSWNTQGDAVMVTASGAGNVLLYIDGKEVKNPCSLPFGTKEQNFQAFATAQAPGCTLTTCRTVSIAVPAKASPVPVVTTREEDDQVIITASGEGRVVLYADGKAVNNPFTIKKSNKV